MSNSGMSYTQLVDRMEAFANGHHMIATFMHGQTSLIDLPKDQHYPVMHFLPGTMQYAQGAVLHQFDITFYDLPRAKEVENEYQREVISDMARLALDLIAEVLNGNVLFGRDVIMDGTPTITPFMEEYSQVVTGVTLSMGLIVPYDWSACDIPADYSVGGSGSGGSGSGSGGITLKVNGTNNAVQNILDLVQGTNIVIEDLGDGRVRIRATGGGGGGADWGSIGGNIEDQSDLIALLLNYATTIQVEDLQDQIDAETAARVASDNTLTNLINNEANERQNADDALQLAINIVAGDLSTETTARQNGDTTNATAISDHVADTNNPHSVTKGQVGLSNVPNVDTTTTANITDSMNKRFVTDAQLAVIDNTSGENTGDETTASIQTKRPLKTVNGNSLEGSGDISVGATQAYRITGAGFTLPAGTRYFGMTNGTTSTVETVVPGSSETDITATKIVVRTTTTQSASSSLVIALRVNGADSALVLTIPASSPAGVYSVSGSVAIAEGDTINYRSATSVTSAGISQISTVYS